MEAIYHDEFEVNRNQLCYTPFVDSTIYLSFVRTSHGRPPTCLSVHPTAVRQHLCPYILFSPSICPCVSRTFNSLSFYLFLGHKNWHFLIPFILAVQQLVYPYVTRLYISLSVRTRTTSAVTPVLVRFL